MFPLKDNIPNDRLPLITIVLVAINVIAYLLAIRHGGSIVSGPSEATVTRYGAVPFALTHPAAHCALVTERALEGLTEVQRNSLECASAGGTLPAGPGVSPLLPAWEAIFTSMFMHANLLHIGGNMLFLAIFGPNVEEAMGRPRYLLFYLLGGLVAVGAQVAASPSATGPMLGASGAIAAVLGGYIVLYPRARILTLVLIIFFVTIVELPALVLLGFWFFLQVIEAEVTRTGSGGGVANFAHIGGFAFGVLMIRLFAMRGRRAVARHPLY
jgi:membrane associated rhomboid family serine protease